MSANTNRITTQNLISSEEFLGLRDAVASAPTADYSDFPKELTCLPNWVCFRHERNHDRLSNVPYRIGGAGHAKSNDPSTWSPFDAALTALANPACKFDGVSFMLLGTPYLGFDFDAVVQNEILDPYVASVLRVMGNPYAELSYSGMGLRVFINCPDLSRPRLTQFKKSGAECAVEIYHGQWAGKALAVTGNRCSGQGIPTITPTKFELVHLLCSQIHDAKFKALWLGDTSAYGFDESRADEAMCCMLARLLDYNSEKIDAAFRWSKLMRAKWTDNAGYYGKRTIAKAIEFERARDTKSAKNQLKFRLPAVGTTEANASDYVLARLPGQTDRDDGWFPRGAVSLVGAPSGASKTTLMYQLLLTQVCKGTFFGHATYGLPFCVMGLDRGEFAHIRTMKRMGLQPNTVPFEALSLAWDFDIVQQIIEKLESRSTVPNVLLLEGVDMMVSEVNDIKCVTIFMNLLNQVAKHFHIAIIGTLGSPKIKVGQGYVAKRDNLLGSSAWGRECECIVNLQFPQSDDTDGRRLMFVLLRNGPAEKFTIEFQHGQLVQIPDIEKSDTDRASVEIEWFQAQARLAKADPTKKWWTILDMERALGLSAATTARHAKDAVAKKYITRKPGKQVGKGAAAQYRWKESKDNPIWVTEKKREAAEQGQAF